MVFAMVSSRLGPESGFLRGWPPQLAWVIA
jgi:hypothetical protein